MPATPNLGACRQIKMYARSCPARNKFFSRAVLQPLAAGPPPRFFEVAASCGSSKRIFVAARPVNRRHRNVEQPQIDGKLSAMMINVAQHHHSHAVLARLRQNRTAVRRQRPRRAQLLIAQAVQKRAGVLHALIEHRKKFLADAEASFNEAGLTDEEKDLVRRRDWRGMIHYGVIFFMLEKLGAVVGVSNLHIYAAMRGESLEEFQKTRNAPGALYSVAGKDSGTLAWEKK